MKRLMIICFLMMLPVFFGCSNKKWEGVVYPDRTKLLIHYESGRFESLEECEKASLAMLESKDAMSNGFYECARNCKGGSSVYDKSCEDLIRGNYYK